MKRAFLIPLVLGLVCSLTPFSASAASVSAPDITTSVVSESEAYNAERVAVLVNQLRKENGLSEVKIVPTLYHMADIRAKEIAVKFDHLRPDGTGLQEFVQEYNLNWRKVGENIAKGQATPEDAVNSWMNSPKHRENILDPNYQYIGVSCYYANGMYHWVQIFLKAGAPYTSAYMPRNFGDVNDDGVVDGVDATTVLTDYARRSVGVQGVLDEPHLDIADMTRDGIVNAVDATSIFTVYVRNSVSF